MAATTSLVTQITGQAWVRGADGSLTPLHQGMRVPVDADIVTATGASVQLQADGVPPLTIGENRDVQLSADTVQPDVDPSTAAVAPPADPDVAQVLAALNAGDDPLAELDPTAAVLQGGAGGDGGSSFTRLVSIVETTNPLGLEYPRPGTPAVEDVRLAGTGGGESDQLPAPTLAIADGNGIEAGQLTIAEDASESAPGSFTISAPAGLAFVTIGDTTLSAAQLGNVGNAPVTIQTANGQITLTGFDAATGTVTYEYTVGGAQDHSAGDDTVVDTVAITVTDSTGRQVTDNLGVHITDTNPMAASEDGGQLVEDSQQAGEISGNVLDNDTVFDGPGSVSWNNPVNAEVLSRLEQFGTITLGADGKWTFTLDNSKPAVQALAEGQEVDFEISYTVTDSDGDTASATLTFKVVGTNDAPTITSADQAATVTELVDLVDGENTTVHEAGGAVTFADVDLTDTHTATVAARAEGYVGTLTLGAVDQAGNSVGWTFQVSDGVLDSLAEGQTLTQSYDVTIADGNGGSATQTVTITIVGTNDAPTITSADQAATVTELGDLVDGENTTVHEAGGAVTFADVDLTDTHTATVAARAEGYVGTLTLGAVDQTGNSVGWTFQVSDGVLDSLAEGQTLTQSYDVTITDGNGGNATQTVTVTIVGTNDVPTITSTTQSATITEVADNAVGENTTVHEAGGAVTFADVDLADTHTATASAKGEDYVGTLTLGAVDQAGNSVGWTFQVADGALDSLAEGQTLTQSYDVTIADGNGGSATQTVTITIVGTNDAPTITFANDGTVAVSEEGLNRYLLRPDGIPDGAPDSDTTNSTKASGAFQVNDVDHSSVLAVKLGIPVDALTSDGKPVTWTLSQDGKT
ncbi:retention module-containing protein, partial [Pollutimonas bauzanensis]